MKAFLLILLLNGSGDVTHHAAIGLQTVHECQPAFAAFIMDNPVPATLTPMPICIDVEMITKQGYQKDVIPPENEDVQHLGLGSSTNR